MHDNRDTPPRHPSGYRPARPTLVPATRALTFPPAINPFRLFDSGSNMPWLGDEMGSPIDPDDPRPTRRDFLVRLAIATAAFGLGGAVNVALTALAR